MRPCSVGYDCLVWQSIGGTRISGHGSPRTAAGPRTTLSAATYREDRKSSQRDGSESLASWRTPMINRLRRCSPAGAWSISTTGSRSLRSLPHGHVAAVLGVVGGLDLERLIFSAAFAASMTLCMAMIAQQVFGPVQAGPRPRVRRDDAGRQARLRRGRRSRSGGDELAYRQKQIEERLARRHLARRGFRACGLSSSYLRGALLFAGCARLLARQRRGGKTAGQLRADLQPGRAASRGLRARGQRHRTTRTVPDTVAAVCERFGSRTSCSSATSGMIAQRTLPASRSRAWTSSARSRACRSARW